MKTKLLEIPAFQRNEKRKSIKWNSKKIINLVRENITRQSEKEYHHE